MTEIKRRSPVVFPGSVKQSEIKDNWTVVTAYESEGQSPHIVDLTHRSRWDLQDGHLDEFKPWGITIPETPGLCRYENGILISRMNHTQASLWHLSGDSLETPDSAAYTDTADATIFLAILGDAVFGIAEKLSALDFSDPSHTPPTLFQGPFSHVPCQIVLIKNAQGDTGILLTCSRGYAKNMLETILHAGSEYNLRPAGENIFNNWIQ